MHIPIPSALLILLSDLLIVFGTENDASYRGWSKHGVVAYYNSYLYIGKFPQRTWLRHRVLCLCLSHAGLVLRKTRWYFWGVLVLSFHRWVQFPFHSKIFKVILNQNLLVAQTTPIIREVTIKVFLSPWGTQGLFKNYGLCRRWVIYNIPYKPWSESEFSSRI